MEKIYQTIIIGAGPAGLTVGRYLDSALILEQKKEIGQKVQCAEGLAKEFLEKLEILPQSEWICSFIDKTQIIFPNKKSFFLKEKEGLYILDRIKFEKFLASLCRAKILLKKKVVDVEKKNDFFELKTQDKETFKCKYLVGADGPFSIVRRKIFKEKIDYLPCVEYLVKLERKVEKDTIKMFFDNERFPFGYAWIFPKGENLANIGFGAKSASLRETFENFMKEVEKEYGKYQLLKDQSGVVPFLKKPFKPIKENAFLIGDAGGMVDPITGGGIGNAMIAGKELAQCIIKEDFSPFLEKIKKLSCFSESLFSLREILASLENNTLNEIGEILEYYKESPFSLFKKSFSLKVSVLIKSLSKPYLRKNIFKFLKMFFLYKNYLSEKKYGA